MSLLQTPLKVRNKDHVTVYFLFVYRTLFSSFAMRSHTSTLSDRKHSFRQDSDAGTSYSTITGKIPRALQDAASSASPLPPGAASVSGSPPGDLADAAQMSHNTSIECGTWLEGQSFYGKDLQKGVPAEGRTTCLFYCAR